MTGQRVHLLRAKSFYETMKKTLSNLVTLIFDCQQNFVLPRFPDQATYYARQYYMFNKTVVEQRQDCRLIPRNIFAYT